MGALLGIRTEVIEEVNNLPTAALPVDLSPTSTCSEQSRTSSIISIHSGWGTMPPPTSEQIEYLRNVMGPDWRDICRRGHH